MCSQLLKPMEYTAQNQPIQECQAAESEAYLRNLISSMAKDDSAPNGPHWIEEGASKSFFEFTCFNDGKAAAALSIIELFASKTYNPNGIIVMSMYYRGNWYLALDDGEDFPLLDSKFPNLLSEGHGYNIQCYPSSVSGCPQLRKMSICVLVTTKTTCLLSTSACINLMSTRASQL